MKKKKRSRASKQALVRNGPKQASISKEKGEKEEALNNLVDAFASISIEESPAACEQANKDATIFENLVEGGEDKSTVSSSSGQDAGSSSGSSVSEVFVGHDYAKNNKGRAKKVVAVAGTVANMLGKDYVRSTPKKVRPKFKEFGEVRWSKEDADQFLCSMLGEDCELSMAVVRDVLCQCGYDVEKALNILLELSASSREQTKAGESNGNVKEDYPFESTDSLTDRTSDSTSHSSENERENVWYTGHPSRNHSEVFARNETYSSTRSRNSESELPQQVLESLFNMPTPKNAEHEPSSMNWRNVVKKLASLGQKVESSCGYNEAQHHMHETVAKGDEYQVFREAAKQHWESMRSCYQKAATAFTNGERGYAAYLSEQGRVCNKMAREADEKASQDIFIARNKSIENMITIDLHGQHVKQAMRLLKLHLLFGAYVRSVRLFRIITGCGSHGVGRSKLKQSVIILLDKEGIQWSEENRGTLLVKLNGQTDFSFLDTDSDDE